MPIQTAIRKYTAMPMMRSIKLPWHFCCALLLCGCTTPSPTRAPAGFSLEPFLRRVVTSDDGLLFSIHGRLPQRPGQRFPHTTLLETAPPFITTDGYAIGEQTINFQTDGEIFSYSFLVTNDKCLSIRSIPGFEHIAPRFVFDSPAAPFSYTITNEQVQISLSQRAGEGNCLAGVWVGRKR